MNEKNTNNDKKNKIITIILTAIFVCGIGLYVIYQIIPRDSEQKQTTEETTVAPEPDTTTVTETEPTSEAFGTDYGVDNPDTTTPSDTETGTNTDATTESEEREDGYSTNIYDCDVLYTSDGEEYLDVYTPVSFVTNTNDIRYIKIKPSDYDDSATGSPALMVKWMTYAIIPNIINMNTGETIDLNELYKLDDSEYSVNTITKLAEYNCELVNGKAAKVKIYQNKTECADPESEICDDSDIYYVIVDAPYKDKYPGFKVSESILSQYFNQRYPDIETLAKGIFKPIN